jgi:hypothetical protein
MCENFKICETRKICLVCLHAQVMASMNSSDVVVLGSLIGYDDLPALIFQVQNHVRLNLKVLVSVAACLCKPAHA